MKVKDLLYTWIEYVAGLHDAIMRWNDQTLVLSDKALHFIIFGVFGLVLFLICRLIVNMLRKHPAVTAWLLALLLVTLVALAVEVGQDLSGSGTMDIRDLAAGIFGFIAFTVVTMMLRLVFGGRKKHRR